MKRLTLLVALAACAPARDDAAETAASDSLATAATTTTYDERPDTSGKATSPTGQATSTAAAQTAVRGTVRVTGTAAEPITTLEIPGGSLVVRGALEPEIRALDGATVQVTGQQNAGPPRSIEIAAYSIAEIDGQPAITGIVTADARSVVSGRDTISLVTPPVGLPPGARVWVSGQRTANQVRVASWGVIRPAQ